MAADQGRGSPPGKLNDADRARIEANARAILTRELGLTFGREDGRGWAHALCPLHSEKTPSFGVSRNGAIRCQGCGFSGDTIAVLEKARGCTPGEAIRLALGSDSSGPPRRPGPAPSPASTTKNNGALVSPIPGDAPPLPPQEREAARYVYRDEAGRPLLYVVRLEPGQSGRPGSKDCIPWTLRRFPNDSVRWRRTLSGVTPRPLYGAETLTDGATVLFVEGEKAADAARRQWPDLCVVTTLGGCGAKNEPHALHLLAGRRVTFWPDADEPGRGYAHTLALRVHDAGAASVAVVELPDSLPAGWDLADLGHELEAGRARELIDAAPALASLRNVEAGAEWEDRDEDGKPWEPFEDIPADPFDELPAFNLELLPPMLGRYAAALAAPSKSDPAMAAVSLLVGVGAAAALKCCLRVGDVPKPIFSNLGALLVADVAEGKSSAVNPVKAATEAALRLARKDNAHAVRRYELALEQATERRDEARKKHKADQDSLTDNLLSRAEDELQELIDRPIRPIRYVGDDLTAEQLPQVMADNDGRVFVCSAEPAFLANLSGRYDAKSGAGSLQKLESILQAMTNEPIQIRRKDRETSVELPAASVLVGLHPSVIADLRAGRQMEERGLFSRFLFVNGKSGAAKRRWSDYAKPGDPEAEQAFAQVIESLTRRPLPEGLPLIPDTVRTTPGAVELLAGYHDETVPQVAPGGKLEPVKGWALRSTEIVQRLALVIHCAKHPNDFLERNLSADTMAAAVAMMRDYFMPHAIHAHLGGVAGDLEQAGKLAHAWAMQAAQDGRRVLSLTEIRKLGARFERMKGEALAELLETLEGRGIVRKLEKRKQPGPGAPAHPFELHPRFGRLGEGVVL